MKSFVIAWVASTLSNAIGGIAAELLLRLMERALREARQDSKPKHLRKR